MKKFISILLLFLSLTLHAETFYICHLNDFHGYLYQGDNCQIAKIETLFKGISLRHCPCLFFDSGDFLSGSVYANYFQGESVARIFEMMPFTFHTFGNHEFDYPSPRLKELSEKYHLPFLSTNVVPKVDFPIVSSTIMTIGYKKIGILGLTTEDAASLSNPKATCDFSFLKVTAETAKILKEFKKKGTDFIIAVSHLGFVEDKKLAGKFPQIDLILGGHSHDVIEKPYRTGNTTIVQAGTQGQYIGFLKISIEAKKTVTGGLIEVKPYLMDDPFIKPIAEEYRAKLKAALGQPIATLLEPLPVDPGVNRGETKIGNLLTDAIRLETGADIAMLNAGGIRKSLPQGTITGEDLYNTLPFNNSVVFYRLDKKEITEMIKHGLNAAVDESIHGRFAVVSGISYRASLKNSSEGLIIERDGKPLEEGRTYLVAVPDFIADGGDGYTVFKGKKQVDNQFNGIEIRELVRSYLVKNPNPKPVLEGRIDVKTDPL
ncbi:MAG: bifunctional UDP-sugar hydrolase/5'-nucleotidase [Candidatus Wallbacteria bacterium]|nr:bifunctional UDP-sugar hydrolase/5'-nucleotidase [Candidatus Wallbacteria bacterium]